MKSAIFHDEAFAELNEAVEYYESQSTDLGRELRLATEAAVAQIESHPTMWPFYKDTPARHRLVPRFPYVIYYLDEPECLWMS